MPLPSLQIQDRDYALLRTLFECRVMTADHVATLHFEGKTEAAKKRLQKLKASGLINARPRRSFEPAVLILARKGLMLLRDQGILNEYPTFHLPALDRRSRVSDLTIRHELEVMDVKAAFHAAITATTAFAVAEFSTWPLLNEFSVYRPDQGKAEVLVKPDGFIQIHETQLDGEKFERTFFLEVDRSTEVQEVLVSRVGCYYNYYKSGGFALRKGGKREEYKDYPFRVLLVFKTPERRNNFAERLLQSAVPVSNQICLATFSEVTMNPLGPIWVTPASYREAASGTPYDTSRPQISWAYRRQVEREVLIERTIVKQPLLS